MEKLGTVLMHIKEYTWSHALYLPVGEKWHTNSKCMVLDPNDVEDDTEDIPTDAKNNQLEYSLDVNTIQSIYDNLEMQNQAITEETLFRAFLYYYDNDAYIIIEK